MNKFILTITDNKNLGLILEPHVINVTESSNYDIVCRLTMANYSGYEELLNDQEIEIIKIAEQFNNVHINNLFNNNNKKTIKVFVNSITEKLFNSRIKPYIDTLLKEIFEIARSLNLELFFKEGQKISVYDQLHYDLTHCTCNLNMVKDEDEIKYFIEMFHLDKKIDLKNSNARFLTLNPCVILISNTIYSVDIDGRKLKPFFNLNQISIPKGKQRIWFDTFGLKNIQQFDVRTSGFEIEEVIPIKRAIFKLELNFKGLPIVIPLFKYNNNTFNFGRGVNNHSSLITRNEELIVSKFSRDLKWEQDAVDLLETIGFKRTMYMSYSVVYDKNIDKNAALADFLQIISSNSKLFLEKGIQIKQTLNGESYSLDEISIERSLQVENDWFDIKIIVKIGEFEYPFKTFKNYILNDKREFCLPNGDLYLLPNDWFLKYKEFFMFAKEKDDSFLINKSNLAYVDEAELLPENLDIEETILNLKESIDDFELKTPKTLNAELRPYQFDGYKWMSLLKKNFLGGLLADDMGLGKTIQTITTLLASTKVRNSKINRSFDSRGGDSVVSTVSNKVKMKAVQLSLFDKPITELVDVNGFNEIEKSTEPSDVKITQNDLGLEFDESADEDVNHKPSLIVMPVSLVHNWRNEIYKFAPTLKLLIYHGKDRVKALKDMGEYDVVLTSYGTMRNDIEKLSDVDFNYLILDESQNIKNPFSKIYKAVLKLNSLHRIALTGTPIENSLTDLWSQMNFLNDGVLGNLEYFKQQYVIPIERGSDELVEAKLKRILEPFMLRRTKEEVVKDLPPVSHQVVYCGMSEQQKEFYLEEKNKVRNLLLEEEGNKKSDNSVGVNILGALLKLRQISCHPVLALPTIECESQKFNTIVSDIENIVAGNHKVLIFSSFVSHLALYEERFKNEGVNYAMISGSLSPKQREQQINKFKSESDCKIFLISLKAGGAGLNLTEADYVFLIDPWWNPKAEEQAIARAHRIGQKRNVMVYRYITVDTIEEKIEILKQRKSQLSDTFIQSTNPLKLLSTNEIHQVLID